MRRIAVLLIALTALAAPSAAGAQGDFLQSVNGDEALDFTEVPLRVTGAVSVDFRGDEAAGCEVARLCGVSGTVTWNPAGPGTLLVFGYREADGTHTEQSFMSFGDERRAETPRPTTYSRVTRGDALCADVGSTDSTAFVSAPRAGHSVELGLLTSEGLGASVVQVLRTRCAGPLAADVAGLLPTHVISDRALRRHPNTLDFSAERTFSAHGLTGTVHSTVVFHLRRGAGADNQPDGGSPPKEPTRVIRRRALEVRYKVEQVSGQAVTGLRGLADPELCGPLDSCGLAGTVTAAPRASSGEAVVFAEASARHPWSDLRRAVGLARGPAPRGLRAYGFVSWTKDSGTTTSDLTRDGAPDCADSEPLAGGGSLALRLSSGVARVGYGEVEEPGVDLLATRCPGPTMKDVAPVGALASATVPVRALGARRVTLRLTRGPSFLSDGYRGSVSSDVTVVLRRTKVKRQTFSFSVSGTFTEVALRRMP
jgi:hypothetical protein